MYTELIKKENGLKFTPDMRYVLIPDPDGFSYWYETKEDKKSEIGVSTTTRSKMGDHSYDYSFQNDDERSLKKINYLINR